jgi:DNA-binding NtrC family response regulator
MNTRSKILVVEDDDLMQGMLKDALGPMGHELVLAADGVEAWETFGQGGFDLVLADYKLPRMDGIQLLKKIKAARPDAIVILMTAYGTVESAVEAMKSGAYDFITKPFLSEEIVHLVRKGMEFLELKRENVRLRQTLEERVALGSIIGKSRPMQELFRLIEVVAPMQSTVLIQGESGTGKERVADAIHHLSPRRNKPLIKVSCAALPETLLESELFGHEKGAFTDAATRKIGRFELADKGSLFLDDIDDLNPNVQVKLLRVLQEKELERVGGVQTIKIDVRMIAATKSDLQEKIKKGRFRSDLFYRLNVVPMLLPPLRERKEDIPLLVGHFLKKFNGMMKKDVVLSDEVLSRFMKYNWPGNIRELENLIERLVTVTVTKTVRGEDLPQVFRETVRWSPSLLKNVVMESEKEHILRVLDLTGGKKKEAAGLLGITPKTLWQKLKEYKL